MNGVVYFALSALLIVIVFYIILKIAIKKFNPEKSKVKIYGVLQGMSNREIVSIAINIISYVFLIYIFASFIDLDIYITIIIMCFSLISNLLIKNKHIILNIILNIIPLGGIKIVYLIHDYLVNELYSMWMLLLLVFVMIFLFLYLSYVLLNNNKNVIASNKHIRKGDNI